MLLGYILPRESKEERGEGLLRWSVLGALNNEDEEDLALRERET